MRIGFGDLVAGSKVLIVLESQGYCLETLKDAQLIEVSSVRKSDEDGRDIVSVEFKNGMTIESAGYRSIHVQEPYIFDSNPLWHIGNLLKNLHVSLEDGTSPQVSDEKVIGAQAGIRLIEEYENIR